MLENSNNNPPEITSEMFDELKKELRKMDLSWLNKLYKQIITEDSIDPELTYKLTAAKVYQVFSGYIRNPMLRVMVYGQSKKLKERLREKMQILNDNAPRTDAFSLTTPFKTDNG